MLGDGFEPDYELPDHLKMVIGSDLQQAVEQFRGIINNNPAELDAYHGLFQLWQRSGEYDAAWCVAGALASLGKANKAELKFYRASRGDGIIEPSQPLDHGMWVHYVMAEEQDQLLSQLMGTLYAHAGELLHSQRLKDLGISPKDRLDLGQPAAVCRVVSRISELYGIAIPEVYLDRAGRGIRTLPTFPMVLAVGSDQMADKPTPEMVFMAGKCLAYFHAWHPMAALYEPNQLGLMVIATARVVAPDLPMFQAPPGLPNSINSELKTLSKQLGKRLAPEHKEALAHTMKTRQMRPQPIDMPSWDRAVELTANHAAIYISSDIEAAGRVMRKERKGELSPADPQAKREDFLKYVVSERFHELRGEMDIQVQGDATQVPWVLPGM